MNRMMSIRAVSNTHTVYRRADMLAVEAKRGKIVRAEPEGVVSRSKWQLLVSRCADVLAEMGVDVEPVNNDPFGIQGACSTRGTSSLIVA
jgi:hypothetical protein